jgi:hypothetical protein
LLDQCRETYFASASERKRRFHRTLVDLGMIDLAPGVQRGRYSPALPKIRSVFSTAFRSAFRKSRDVGDRDRPL